MTVLLQVSALDKSNDLRVLCMQILISTACIMRYRNKCISNI